MFVDLELFAEIALSLQSSEVHRHHEDSQTYGGSEIASTDEDATSVAAKGADDAAPTTTLENSNVHADQNNLEPEPAESSK